MRTLRWAGFENLSLDLIFGLPPALERDWAADLERALALAPAHLSLYGLTVEPRTPLARWVARGATGPPEDERYAEEYLAAHARLAAAGYAFYEVSNASLPDRWSRHNVAYWTGRPYLGIGPSAHSFDGAVRRWNLAAWEAYRRAVLEGRSPIDSEEALSEEQRALERLYLGLRRAEGVPATIVPHLHQPPPTLRAILTNGWLVAGDGRVRCTVEGWLRLDGVVAALTGSTATS
jgi:oxygen-independent coproporphyrinogen-3 oxidase